MLTTFPESRRLKVHRLPPGENRADTYLIWRKGADSPKVQALRDLLTSTRVTKSTMTMAEMHAVAAMPVPAASGRRSNRSRGQSESRDGSEGNLAKHSCSPFQA